MISKKKYKVKGLSISAAPLITSCVFLITLGVSVTIVFNRCTRTVLTILRFCSKIIIINKKEDTRLKDYIYAYSQEELNILTERLVTLKKRYKTAATVYVCIAVLLICSNFIIGHILPFAIGIAISVAFAVWSVYYFDVVYGKCKRYYKYLDAMTGTNEEKSVATFIGGGEDVEVDGFDYNTYKFYDKVKEKEVDYIVNVKSNVLFEDAKDYYLIVANRHLIAYKEANE